MDIDEKQKELDNLKADRARDLSRLQGTEFSFSTFALGINNIF